MGKKENCLISAHRLVEKSRINTTYGLLRWTNLWIWFNWSMPSLILIHIIVWFSFIIKWMVAMHMEFHVSC